MVTLFNTVSLFEFVYIYIYNERNITLSVVKKVNADSVCRMQMYCQATLIALRKYTMYMDQKINMHYIRCKQVIVNYILEDKTSGSIIQPTNVY